MKLLVAQLAAIFDLKFDNSWLVLQTGGTSNRQKNKSKGMPLAAKRAIVARTNISKKMKGRAAAKQFRGKKAWKQ